MEPKAGAMLGRPVLSGLEGKGDNLLTLGMVTIITVAIGENVSAVLWRWNQTHCKLGNVPHRFGPASLREPGLAFRVTCWSQVAFPVCWFRHTTIRRTKNESSPLDVKFRQTRTDFPLQAAVNDVCFSLATYKPRRKGTIRE